MEFSHKPNRSELTQVRRTATSTRLSVVGPAEIINATPIIVVGSVVVGTVALISRQAYKAVRRHKKDRKQQ